MVNCIDFVYFPFTNKRSGFDIFNQVFGGQTDVARQIPHYIRDFWLVFILYAAMIFFLFWCWKRISWKPAANTFTYSLKNSVAYTLLFSFACGLLVVGMRGGLQYIPLQVVDAGKYATPKNVALVLNTPFSIIRSYDSERLAELTLADNRAAEDFIRPIQSYKGKEFNKKNIVVLILESFSKEYTGMGNRKSLTPFLDSLARESLAFTNAWANGKQSIEGIPAIISSMPSLMNNPYINTKYADNQLNSFPQLLKWEGYASAFFHGGKNGTMNFDSYANLAGYDQYFGMSEYGNDADFDGQWGIWDEPYLQYCAKKFNELKPPFFASVFTLSSHHPFRVPDQYKNKFPETALEISTCIGYTDHALRKFFDTARKAPWYSNTLFVLVPDHTGMSTDPFYANQVGQHAIPLLFFAPDGSMKGTFSGLVQQTDIMPTVLDTLGYSGNFFSFGKSAFRGNDATHALFYDSGNYYVLRDSFCFIFNNHELKQGFKFAADSALQKDIAALPSPQRSAAQNYYRHFIQLYHHALNNNLTHAR